MRVLVSALVPVLAVAACSGSSNGNGNGNSTDAGQQDARADATADATEPPLTVQVAPGGNDASDGIAQPVKTLQRGVAIAGANPRVTAIALAAGTYRSQDGESFPYTVPHGVSITGPDGGGAVLSGDGTQIGLVIDSAALRNVALGSFTVAVTAKGAVTLDHIQISDSDVAIQGLRDAGLMLSSVELTGSAQRCATGLLLEQDTTVTASALTARDIGHVLESASASGAIAIDHATISSALPDAACQGAWFLIDVLAGASFSLTDSAISGGVGTAPATVYRYGLWLDGLTVDALPPATIARTTLSGFDTALHAEGVALQMSDSTVSSNTALFSSGAQIEIANSNIHATTAALSHVTVQQNRGDGISLRGTTADLRPSLTMRDCTVTGNNENGVSIDGFGIADLGTAASPGNNAITGNIFVGLEVTGTAGQSQVTAVGNTWRAGTQGSDGSGHYASVATVSGPIDGAASLNFEIADGCSVVR